MFKFNPEKPYAYSEDLFNSSYCHVSQGRKLQRVTKRELMYRIKSYRLKKGDKPTHY